jgi:hypothetical protein
VHEDAHAGDGGDHCGGEPGLDHQELLSDLRAGLDDLAALAIQLDGMTQEGAQLAEELRQLGDAGDVADRASASCPGRRSWCQVAEFT